MTVDRTVEVVPEAGLHARPAAKFVETAGEYDAEISIGPAGADDDALVPAGSMLAVTGLGVASGESVRLRAEGPDEEAALEALAAILGTPEEGD